MKQDMPFKIGNRSQRGVAAVEFALVAGLFFSLLIGVMEMGRVLFYWNTATEATRLGARIAVVCDVNDSAIKTKMSSLFPMVSGDNIQVLYSPAGCSVETCDEVTVRIQPVAVTTLIPYIPLTLNLPAFATTLPRESLASEVDDVNNPVCQ
ncbi:TadE/TadG family type IV pilus assembly protein [Aromatoleum diolicum]|uniref:Pilus assembly protein n=1 Tax=Aromatoleum diolicum TaxID=75796 RepID=A0ABX1QBF3_9RHOO|nr:TadE family protein [Aromatoleum diolicum]NMG74351.1 pilus assembly protein [Aromatoleum diolicum]